MSEYMLISAGATGGHILPALVVARQLVTKGYRVLWFGAAQGLDEKILASQLLPEEREDILVNLVAWKRNGSAPLVLLRAFWAGLKLRKLVATYKPSGAIGFGGSPSLPAMFCAKSLGLPMYLHEQNAILGRANRLMAIFARKIFCTFAPEQMLGLGKYVRKCEHSGLPLRSSITQIAKLTKSIEPTEFTEQSSKCNESTKQLRVLVLGGSLGAGKFNEQLPRQFAKLFLLAQQENWKLIVKHQCGAGKLGATLTEYQRALADMNLLSDSNQQPDFDRASICNDQVEVEVVEFIDQMQSAYLQSDIVVARAGASSVAEICAVGKPAMFIPLAGAIDNHQFENAKRIADQQAAVLVEEKDIAKDVFAEAFATLRDKLEHYAERSASLARLDADQQIVSAISQDLLLHK